MKTSFLAILSLSTSICAAQNVSSIAPNASPTPTATTNLTVLTGSGATPMNGNTTNTPVVPTQNPSSAQKLNISKTWLTRFQNNLTLSQKSNAANPAQVIFDGDSITDFWCNRAPVLWKNYEEKYHAINFGISGDTTGKVLYRLNHGQAKGMHPKLIFLMIGHNNVLDYSSQQIYEDIAAIIKKYQETCPNARIILQATFPSKEPNSKWRNSIAALNKLLPNLAQKDKVIYVDFSDKFLSTDGTISKEIMPDGTHPVEKGYQIWAAAIQPILDQYIPQG